MSGSGKADRCVGIIDIAVARSITAVDKLRATLVTNLCCKGLEDEMSSPAGTSMFYSITHLYALNVIAKAVSSVPLEGLLTSS